MIIQTGGKIALFAGEQRISYSNLVRRICMYSDKLEGMQGRTVIFSENRPAWAYAFFASWNNGLIPVPIDHLSTVADFEYIVKDCNPSVIFCSPEKRQVVEHVLENVKISPQIIDLDECEGQDSLFSPEPLHFGQDSGKTAVIIYTSGTTGKPKGVMLSFGNLQANIEAVCHQIRIFTPEDHVLMLLPLHHILPLLGTLVMPLTIGCGIAIAPSLAPGDILRTLVDHKISLIIGVPRLFASMQKSIKNRIKRNPMARILFILCEKIDSRRLSLFVFKKVHKQFGGNIKFLVSGGAPLEVSVARDFRTLGFELLEGYGMSEAAPMIAFNHPGKIRLGSVGFKLWGTSVEVRDKELVAKGPNVMKGYWNRPEETAGVIKDGWLHTGDLGYIDKDGYIFVTGRKKEIMVFSNGKNVNPFEVEEHLERISPVVKEAGVFQDGDRIRAIVVPDMAGIIDLDIKDIQVYLTQTVLKAYNQSVASYKMITDASVSVSDLPRTRMGKIQRYLLPSLAAARVTHAGARHSHDSEEYLLLKTFLEKTKGIVVRPDMHLILDLAFDSLERVALQVFIESSFGVSMNPEQLLSFDSVVQLSEYLGEHKNRMTSEMINWTQILNQQSDLKLPASWMISYFFLSVVHLFFRFFFRFRGKGAANIPKEPCIIVPNHQSMLDALLVASLLKYPQMRNTFFYAKEKHIHSPLMKYLASRNNIIVMDMNQNLKESIQKMADVLKKKKNLIIFPEGTRTRDGKLGNFKKTFAILSRELNVPVVPVSIHGAFEAMPRGRFFPLPFRSIRVDFHAPVYPGRLSYDRLSDKVHNLIRQHLESLVGKRK